jgi:hypothetical protein
VDIGGSTTTVSDCTFSRNGNGSTSGGGGIRAAETVIIENCILWNNTPDQIGAFQSPTLTVTESNVQGGWTGTGNINSDPLFGDDDGPDNVVGTLDDNLRLTCTSPSLNTGDSSLLPADTFDLDLNPNTTVLPHDLDGDTRVLQSLLDMGAYESVGGSCPANIITTGTSANQVDIDDLIAVILGWGTLVIPGTPPDVAPPCAGDGQIDVDDLIAVILEWGPCNESGESPNDLEDCLELCGELTGQDFLQCFDACLEALCNKGLTQYCD